MKNKGFTLLEMIVSISLILLLSSFWLYQNTFLPVLQKQEVEKFVSDIRYIKQLGLQGDTKAKILLDWRKNRYTLYSKDGKEDIYFQNGVKLDSYTLKEIYFYENAWTKGNTIRLKTKKHQTKTTYTIKISSITGRIKWEV